MKRFLFSGALLASIAGCGAQQANTPNDTPQVLAPALASTTSAAKAELGKSQSGPFERVAQMAGEGEVAEIVVASRDGKTLLYNDAKGGKVGFVNIENPARPKATGLLTVGGEPTSLAFTHDNRFGLVCVRPTQASDKPRLVIFDPATRRIVRTMPLSGQPDCIKVSEDGKYAVIAIENERQNLEAPMPQAPPGNVTIIDLGDAPSTWKARVVPVSGLPVRFASDPEPEYIAINARNEAAISLQENNGVCIIDLKSGRVLASWSCGITEHAADLEKDGEIRFSDTLRARREPDSLAWTPAGNILTANEGDYDTDESDFRAGGRDITLFDRAGKVLWDSGNQLDEAAAQNSSYEDKRSSKRGSEPEGVEVAAFGDKTYAFIGCERAHGVAVYDISGEASPKMAQWLGTGENPEGVLAIPQRRLLVTANEGDNTLTIFRAK